MVSTTACGRRVTALDRVRESGVLRVATDPSFPPFEFVDEAGQIVGFDADLAAALAQELHVDLQLVTTGYDALYDALTVGQADIIISALYPDTSRSAGFAFSPPYYDAGDVLVVRQGSDITTATDLAGHSVAVVFGTTGHMTAIEWEETLLPPPELITLESPITITTLLHSQTADAIIVDHVSAQTSVGQDPELRILLPPLSDEPYVIATRREDADLMTALTEILEELESDGTLETLICRWMR